MARVLSWAPDVLVLLVIALHVALAPYAKVEESFNLQATHDVLYHGRNLGRYDHHDFPGVVPRTFAGAVVLAGLVAPIKWLIERSDSIGSLDGDAVAMQIVARLALGACTALAIARFRFALASRIGAPASVAFALLTATSFHQTFYASRTLPNVFALILATHAMAWELAMRKGKLLLALKALLRALAIKADDAATHVRVVRFLHTCASATMPPAVAMPPMTTTSPVMSTTALWLWRGAHRGGVGGAHTHDTPPSSLRHTSFSRRPAASVPPITSTLPLGSTTVAWP